MSQAAGGTKAAIESDMAALAARLRAARQGLSQGIITDLEPVERHVQRLCGQIAALPREEARGLRPRVMGLLEELNHLGEHLHAGLDELAQLLGEAGERRRALTAYAAQKPAKP